MIFPMMGDQRCGLKIVRSVREGFVVGAWQVRIAPASRKKKQKLQSAKNCWAELSPQRCPIGDNIFRANEKRPRGMAFPDAAGGRFGHWNG
jgi:hypothetical protein